MSPTTEATKLYTLRSWSYLYFVNAFAYPQGMQAYWQKSTHLKPGVSVLDAGCGTGIATLALRKAMISRRLRPGKINCFDITPKMLTLFHEQLRKDVIDGVEVLQADALDLDGLPGDWKNLDLIISSAMMEYLPREHLADALSGLRSRLSDSGSIVLFITRKNWLMKLLIGTWWKANCYQESELEESFYGAGFSDVTFSRFPFPYMHLSLWGHIVEAR